MDSLSYILSLAPNLTVEVVIAHWNSTLSPSTLQKWMYQFKRSQLPWVRLIQVSPEAATAHQVPCQLKEGETTQLACHEYLTKNIGVRHTRGNFITIINVDIVLPKELLQFVNTKPDPNTLYLAANRIDLNETIPLLSLTPEEIYRKAEQMRHQTPNSCPFCIGDFMLLSRQLFWKTRGYAEIGVEYYIEPEFKNRISTVGGSITNVNWAVMHQYHGGRSDRIVVDPKIVSQLVNQYYNSTRSLNWGLGMASPSSIQHTLFKRGEDICGGARRV
jgi:hypothetical protein